MVKKIIVTALVLAAISFAQFGQNSEARPIDKNDYYYHPHTGLYFTTNIGFGYASMNSHHETNRDTTNSSFSGWWTPSIEVRLGGYYVDISAFYAAIGFECGTGKYEKTNPLGTSKEIDASSTRMFFGFGGEFYPIRNKESALYGMFFGFFFGAALEGLDIGTSSIWIDEKQSDVTKGFHNIFGRVEAGYDWWFSIRWRAGIAFNYSYGRFINSENGRYNSSYIDREVISNHNLGLTIRIAH